MECKPIVLPTTCRGAQALPWRSHPVEFGRHRNSQSKRKLVEGTPDKSMAKRTRRPVWERTPGPTGLEGQETLTVLHKQLERDFVHDDTRASARTAMKAQIDFRGPPPFLR